MWSANIDEVLKERGKLIVRVSFNDGKDTDREEYRISGISADMDLKVIIQNKLNELNSIDSVSSKIEIGPFTPVQVEAIPE